ncbi:autotransporter strand-loop-strand O-heptosyltransferase [Lichenicola sp.]|uniref:autotransporter strand-loop-strand O-heptosyltransferase n=1 Tax=Lichenicola sp. TaxID=2804529 RepID=UPI003B00FAD4
MNQLLPIDLEAAGPAAQVKDEPPIRMPNFPPPAARPTQEGPVGIRYDFNLGARLQLPLGQFRARLRDLDTGNILFESTRGGVTIQSGKRFFVRFSLEVWDTAGVLLMSHRFDACDRDVLITLPVGTIGDSVGWMPYAVRFQSVHECRLTVAMAERLIPLFEGAYPHIRFIGHAQVEADRYYATYNIGLFFDDAENIWQPTDFRHVGLHRTAGYILGVDPVEAAPELFFPDESRPVAEPYVCIAVQASTHAKKWTNPHGWLEIVRHLKSQGYRVICIDREQVHGRGLVWTPMPHGAEDETGDRPLIERARWLRHAAAFVGCSSGLAWLAWAAGCPVVMISGFTHPTNEFATPGRVINWHVCNSCWNDPRYRFDHADYLWCPRHKGTDRAFECTRSITAEHVKSGLRAIGLRDLSAAAKR